MLKQVSRTGIWKRSKTTNEHDSDTESKTSINNLPPTQPS